MSTYREITINHDGREIRRIVRHLRRRNHHRSERAGSKTTQVGGSAQHPEGLARIMLRELAQEGKA